MKLYELIDELQRLADKGHSEDEVRLLCADANPLLSPAEIFAIKADNEKLHELLDVFESIVGR